MKRKMVAVGIMVAYAAITARLSFTDTIKAYTTAPTPPTAVNLPIAPTVAKPVTAGTGYALTLNTSGYTTACFTGGTCAYSSLTWVNLQATVNAAAASCSTTGTIIQLPFNSILKANSGSPIVLPLSSCSPGVYNIITTDTPAQGPQAGHRINMSYVGRVPKLTCTPNVPCFTRDSAGANNWILQDIEIERCVVADCLNGNTSLYSSSLIDLSQDQTSHLLLNVSQIPTNIILDRLLIHGSSTQGTQRGIFFDCSNCAFINSSITEIHIINIETQAMSMRCGNGPVLIDNNLMSASSENFLAGGGDCQIPTGNIQPGDMTFTHNYFYKPQSWRIRSNVATGYPTTSVTASLGIVSVTATADDFIHQGDVAVFEHCVDTTYNGIFPVLLSPAPYTDSTPVLRFSVSNANATTRSTTGCTVYTRDATSTLTPTTQWNVKNTFEIKAGMRVKFYGNVLDGSWPAAQTGRAIVFAPVCDSTPMTWCSAGDIDVGWNEGINLFGGFIQSACFTGSGTGITSLGNLGRNNFHDNLIYNSSMEAGFMTSVYGAATPTAQCPQPNVLINHNTMIPNSTIQPQVSVENYHWQNLTGPPYPNFAYNDNIVGGFSQYGFFQAGQCTVNGVSTTCTFPSSYFNNIVYDTVASGIGGQSCTNASNTGTFVPHAIQCPVANISSVGFTDITSSNFQLTPSSIGYRKATDGLDVGVSNYANLKLETTGVIAGTPGQASQMAPPTGLTVVVH